MTLTEYQPGTWFPGIIGRTSAESTPCMACPGPGGQGRSECVVHRGAQGGHMLVGVDNGSSVTPAYEPPFACTGTIQRVIVDGSGEHVDDYEAQMKIALAEQ